MVSNLCFRHDLLCRAATLLQSATVVYEWGVASVNLVHIVVYPSFRYAAGILTPLGYSNGAQYPYDYVKVKQNAPGCHTY